ncbi:hypothetical protein [Prochlorococcus marinus]
MAKNACGAILIVRQTPFRRRQPLKPVVGMASRFKSNAKPLQLQGLCIALTTSIFVGNDIR